MVFAKKMNKKSFKSIKKMLIKLQKKPKGSGRNFLRKLNLKVRQWQLRRLTVQQISIYST